MAIGRRVLVGAAVGGVVVAAFVWANVTDEDEIAHLKDEVRAVAAIGDVPVTAIGGLERCERDSAGEWISRFAQMRSPMADDAVVFVEELGERLEDEGYDDVEVPRGYEVSAMSGDIRVQVLVSEGEARIRATDPVSVC